MIANTDYAPIKSTNNQRRKFMGKILALGGLGLVLDKLVPRCARAKVDGKYTKIRGA
jgi:hypothetical protein